MSLITPNEASDNSFSYWLDAFFTLCEVACEERADLDGLAKKMESKREEARATVGDVDMEQLRYRRHVWKRVRDRFGSFGEECPPEDIGFFGLASTEDGGLAQTDPTVRVYRFSDPNTPVVFTNDDEIAVLMHFFQFYRHFAYTASPKKFVRESLEKVGITKDNYLTHPKSPAHLINNPFKNPFTEDA